MSSEGTKKLMIIEEHIPAKRQKLATFPIDILCMVILPSEDEETCVCKAHVKFL